MSACVGGVCLYDVKEDEGWGNKKKFSWCSFKDFLSIGFPKMLIYFKSDAPLFPQRQFTFELCNISRGQMR